MNLVYQNKAPQKIRTRPIFLLCVFRDEALLLESFIRHYRALGVTHFIMIDNLSVDGGSDYLRQMKNINLLLYEANSSYKQARSGTDWVDACLKKYCKGHYCFIVDTDELFVFDKRKFSSLNKLIERMEKVGANCVSATLLDMYPKVLNNDYSSGDNLLNHSAYFDDLNSTYYKNKGILYDNSLWRTGGVRMRITEATPILQKFPFFKYNFQPLRLNVGCHFFNYKGKTLVKANLIRPLPTPVVLLHFKYVKHDLLEVFKKAVVQNQHWNNSSEYKMYVKALEDKNLISFYDPKYSKKLIRIEDLSSFFRRFNI